MDVAAYTRRKLSLINEREGTNHGEDYYEILYKEVATQFQYSEITFEAGKAKEKAR